MVPTGWQVSSAGRREPGLVANTLSTDPVYRRFGEAG
jgi:hypothetical protein